jgi:hypothetical protein
LTQTGGYLHLSAFDDDLHNLLSLSNPTSPYFKQGNR